MTQTPPALYLDLMHTIRTRLDLIDQAKRADAHNFLLAETSGFHARKIVEAIAFGCMVAIENAIGLIPRDAKGQWNAIAIFTSLQKKGLATAFPSPSIIRTPTPDELVAHPGVGCTIDGQPHLRVTPVELAQIYDRLHLWNHELNPYVHTKEAVIESCEPQLWKDIDSIRGLVNKHTISIRGQMFFAVLKDNSCRPVFAAAAR